jgi:outer membrane protein assembly factor BamB
MARQLSRTFFALLAVSLFCGADWLHFRGTDGSGVAEGEKVPLSWSPADTIAWTVELEGRGLSSPIVIGDRVVITSSSGYGQTRLHVLCFDAKSGDKDWERQFWATGSTICHPKTCMAAPTSASDGERIFAFYSTNDLACLDLEGNLLWFRGLTYDFPNACNSIGMSSSPVVVDDTVVVQVEADARAFATGLNVKDGTPRWRIERPHKANWVSPLVMPEQQGSPRCVMLQSSKGLSVVQARTGEEVWSYGEGASTISSSVVVDDVVYAVSGGITALPASTKAAQAEPIWRENRFRPSTASPVVYRDCLYTVNTAGVLTCADVKTRDIKWRVRLEGPISSTPVVADGHMFLFNEKGLGQIVKLGETGELVGSHDFGDTILCTPAIANDALYVRSDKHLWKISESGRVR